VKNQILFAACSAVAGPRRGERPDSAGWTAAADPNAKPPQTLVILSAKDGKIIARLPLAGSSDGATFNLATMEAFGTQGNGTMTIVKEKSPTSFEVEQDLKTWPSGGGRTIAFDGKTGHLFAMASEAGPPPPPPPAGTTPPAGGRGGGRGAAIPGSFTIIMVDITPASSRSGFRSGRQTIESHNGVTEDRTFLPVR
jgi:hypothetical protein